VIASRLFFAFDHDNMISEFSFNWWICIRRVGTSGNGQLKCCFLKRTDHRASQHPTERASASRLVLTVVRSYSIECLPFFQFSHSFENFWLLLTKNVANIDTTRWSSWFGYWFFSFFAVFLVLFVGWLSSLWVICNHGGLTSECFYRTYLSITCINPFPNSAFCHLLPSKSHFLLSFSVFLGHQQIFSVTLLMAKKENANQ